MRVLGYTGIPHRMALLFCAIIFTLLLAACGGGGASSNSTPTPTAAAKPSPTVPPITPTPATTTYTGQGYSIAYPQGWKTTTKTNEVDFVDPTGNFGLIVIVAPDPGGLASPDTLMAAEYAAIKANVKNPQAINVSSPVTIGGDEWLQKAVSGQVNVSGQDVPGQINALIDVHPAHNTSSMSYSILFSGPSVGFDAANTGDFQPMLQSFKFTS